MRLQQTLLLLATVTICTVVGHARADDADDRFAVATGHYAARRWTLAVEEFQTFLDKYPKHIKADKGTFLLAEAALQSGNLERAGIGFRRYFDRCPNGKFARAALFRAGETAYMAGKAKTAKGKLLRFQTKYPDDKLNAYVLTYLGDIAMGRQDTAAAEKCFRECLERFPDGQLQDDCRFGLARALERQQKCDEAERLYRAVAGKSENPLADDAQFHLAVLLYTMEKYTASVETYDAFEAEFASSRWRQKARLGRGWTLMKLGKLGDAESVFQGLFDTPGVETEIGVEAGYWLGMVRREQEDWPGAAETLLQAAEAADAVDPDDSRIPAIRFHAGDALRRAGDLKAAGKQFDLVIASEAADNQWLDDAMHGKIQAAAEADDYHAVDRTAAEFEKQYPKSPLIGSVRRIQAGSQLKRKQYAAAVKLLEPLATVDLLDRQGMVDRYMLAQAYEGLRRYDDALAALLPVLNRISHQSGTFQDSVPLLSRSSADSNSKHCLPSRQAVAHRGSADGSLAADAQLLHGSILATMRRWDNAVDVLEAFLSTDPTGEKEAQGRGLLAICCARTDQLDRAKKLHAELLEKHPKYKLLATITEQTAEAAYAADDRQWAAELFDRLRTAGGGDQNTIKGLAGLGWSQFKTGKLCEAAETFDKLLAKDPPAETAAEAALVRGRILQRLRLADQALVMYDMVIEKYPKSRQHPQAILSAAGLRAKLKQLSDSAALYERFAEQYPDAPQLESALYQWAWVLSDQGKQSESTELFERLRKNHTDGRYWADATFRLSQRALDAKDYQRAGELVDEVLAGISHQPGTSKNSVPLLRRSSAGDNPKHCLPSGQTVAHRPKHRDERSDDRMRENAMYLRGRIAVAEEQWRQVATAFKALLEAFPKTSNKLPAEFWIAEAAYRQEDYQQAGRLFDRLAGLVRGRPEQWLAAVPLRRAQVLVQQGDWSGAYEIASKIEAKYPDFKQLHEADYLIGRCLHARADFQGARVAFRKVIRSKTGARTETAAMAQWMIGETFFHQKDYGAAIRAYLRMEILYDYPTWQAAALLQAGKCREKLGQWNEAAKLYKRVLKVYPDTTFAKMAEKRAANNPANSLTPEAGRVRRR